MKKNILASLYIIVFVLLIYLLQIYPKKVLNKGLFVNIKLTLLQHS